MGEKFNKILKGEIISSVFYVLLGLCLILIPTQTVDVICKVVFGLILIGVGVYHIYIYIRGKDSATIMDLLSGVVVFVLGVFLFMTPSVVLKLLPWMLGAFVLVDSLWKFKGAFLLKKGGQGAWSGFLVSSLIFIALGIVILFGRFPKIMTLLIFAGWVLVCNGAADIILFIIMKLGLRKIAKRAEAENAVEDNVAGDMQEAAPDNVEKEEPQTPDIAENEAEPQKFQNEIPSEENTAVNRESEDTETLSAENDLTSENSGTLEPAGKFQNTRWEKEPQNAEMKLWDAGKDQAETGNLKDLLNSSDEELEEWKD